MLEKQITHKISLSLREYGYWPITQTDSNVATCPRCNRTVQTYPPKGRPDIIVMHPRTRGIVVEVKRFLIKKGMKSLPFSVIDEKQRRWLSNWSRDEGLGFIGIGLVERTSRDALLGIWLIQYESWLEMESGFVRKSLPHNKLDEFFRDARLECGERDLWLLPPGHPARPGI